MSISLTRRQQEIYDYLKDNLDQFEQPPTVLKGSTCLPFFQKR